MTLQRFRDRAHAGQLLATALTQYAHRDDLIVLAMPRGGVPVAFEVAAKLQAPLDVIVVRKLGVPGFEELAMGAIASGGVRVLNEMVIWSSGVSPETIDQVADVEYRELRRRELAYRGHTGTPEIGGKFIILVDDGIATGSTMQAAIKALRYQAPSRIMVAVPTAPPETRAALEGLVDGFVCLMTPQDFGAVGRWYEDFTQVTDSEVTRLLHTAAQRSSQASTVPKKLPEAPQTSPSISSIS